jgi:nitrogen fixation protein FixH
MTTQSLPQSSRSWARFQNWAWFPWAVVGGMLSVILANGALFWFALSTFPGVVAKKPYEIGAAYNSVLAAAAVQDALGWKLTAKIEAGHVALILLNQEGAALTNLTIAGTIARPVGGEGPRDLTFAVGVDGIFRSNEAVSAPGQWDVKLTAQEGETVAYRATRRLLAP